MQKVNFQGRIFGESQGYSSQEQNNNHNMDSRDSVGVSSKFKDQSESIDLDNLDCVSANCPPIALKSVRFDPAKLKKNVHLASTESNDSHQFSKSNKNIKIRDLRQEDQFTCRACINFPSPNCEICKGKQKLRNKDNIVKFFQFIIGYKTGAHVEYSSLEYKNGAHAGYSTSQKYKLQSTGRNGINSFVSQVFAASNRDSQVLASNRDSQVFAQSNRDSSVNMDISCRESRPNRKSAVNRKSTIRGSHRHSYQQSMKSSTACLKRKEDIVNQMNSMLAVHSRHQCDGCECKPIVGIRYHCTVCEDYDLCQQCYKEHQHQHPLQNVQKCEKGMQLQKIVYFMAQPLFQKTTLQRPPSIVYLPQSLTVTKSSIK